MAPKPEQAPRGSLSERLARGDSSMFTELVEILVEAVTVRSAEGEIVYANRAGLELLGFASLEELRSTPSQAIMDDYVVEDENGDPLTMDDVPSVKLMRGGPAEPVLMRVVNRETGELRWNLLKSAALLDDAGTFVGALTVIEDVTAVKTAEVQTRVLAESGRILASSLDYQQTLLNVTGIAVPSLADLCSVDLVGEGGRLERVAATHRDPARGELATKLRGLEPDVPSPGSAIERVLCTGDPALFSTVTDEQLVAVARDDGHLQLLRGLDLRSVLIVPLRVAAQTIGLMTLAADQSRRRFTDGDVELAEQLARRAAVAVENARLHTKLANVATTLQQSLRPSELPAIPGWEVASLYRPAGLEQRIDVGGDFYEFFEHDGTWFAILGDVTGKGVAAASLTALMRHGARVACRSEPAPAAILGRLDEALAQQSGTALCTAICLCLHEDHIVIGSAGHPPAMLVDTAGTVREAPAPGPLLGAFPDSRWIEETVAVAPNELVVLYTDGVTETPGPTERFGSPRLQSLLESLAGQSAETVLTRLDAELDAFAGGHGRDDVAALALCPRGPSG